MSKVFKVLTLLMVFVLQSTLLGFIEIKGVKPDLLLIVVALFSIFDGSFEGSIYGLIGGILQDIFFGHAIGFNTFIYMIIGFILGELSKNLFKEKYITAMSMVLLATSIKYIVYILVMIIINNFTSFTPILYVILFEMIYNSVVSYIVYRLIIKFEKKRNY